MKLDITTVYTLTTPINKMNNVRELCAKSWPKLPVLKKCCFCVPLHKGVTVFGYINLVLSLLSIPVLVLVMIEQVANPPEPLEGDIDPLLHIGMTITFVVVDVSMTTLLLVGAHKRKRSLLKVYLYVGVTFQFLTLLFDLLYFDYREYVENIVYALIYAFNVYLLYLVYSVVHVLKDCADVYYVAHSEL